MAEALRCGLRANGDMRGFPIRLPTADISLLPQGRARLRKFPDGNFRRPLVEIFTARLNVCRNGGAEMATRRRCNGFFLGRAPFGRKREAQPWAGVPPDAVCPRLPESTVRHRLLPRTIRSFVPALTELSRMSPRVEKIARLGDSGSCRALGAVHSSPSYGEWGRAAFAWYAGTMRCGWARLPRVDPLCDRMDARRGGSHDGPPHCISAQPFPQEVGRPVGFRRATAENFRPEIFEARATLREQSGSTLGRRGRQPLSPSPFARNRGLSPFLGPAAGTR